MLKAMPHELHVIFGTGPAGCWIARELRERNIPVRAINRSGQRPDLMPGDVEVVAADASNAAAAMAAARGAGVVYQALNPPYHQWHEYFPGLQKGALAAARDVGARYVSLENLYMYDCSTLLNEESPIGPRSKKGELRARLAEEVMAADKRGDIRATALRSSDYYGPGVRGSALGEMVFGNLVAGKKAQVGGSAVTPHSFAYIEDVGRAAAAIGTRDDALGQVWVAPHAPARTQGEMVEMACRVLAIPPTDDGRLTLDDADGRLVHPRGPRVRRNDVRIHRTLRGRLEPHSRGVFPGADAGRDRDQENRELVQEARG